MKSAQDEFRNAVSRLAHQWLEAGLPSRQVLDASGDELARLRTRLKVRGLWQAPPTMLTATMDDGLGQGLAIIEKFAQAIGIEVIPLGLMQSARAIIDGCRHHGPDFLGMTVLQFDTEADLKTIAENIPAATRIVAGGPVFLGDPEFAERTGTHYAARNVADFLRFMLDEN